MCLTRGLFFSKQMRLCDHVEVILFQFLFQIPFKPNIVTCIAVVLLKNEFEIRLTVSNIYPKHAILWPFRFDFNQLSISVNFKSKHNTLHLNILYFIKKTPLINILGFCLKISLNLGLYSQKVFSSHLWFDFFYLSIWATISN